MEEITLLSERVERASLAALHAAAPREVRERLGLRVETIGTAMVSIAQHDPGILLNRTVGLGIEAPAERTTVGAVVARYAAAGVGRYYLHLHPEARPRELRDWIVDHGLAAQRGWARFCRRGGVLPESRSDLTVRRIGAAQAGDFGRIAARGFGLTEPCAPLLAALAGHPEWHLYLSFDGETPAGAAAMFIRDEVAWLDWAATLPEFRRRGSQGALLRSRLADAVDSGCRFAMTETGEAVEGDPQHSYRNILRSGFEVMHVRANFVPAVTPAGFGVDFSVEPPI